ncbi:inner nuclear membrane protein enriched at telomere/subtelomere region [Entomortierella beljakovae]|nr:inner nuclear membrane protein enriched at telomere/subtelomere region [Entomortierella beljakovae]
MVDSETPHYLHPDFDPKKLKMDQIREILIQHHVKTPVGLVKKQQLVDLFIQHIRPRIPNDINEDKDSDSSDQEATKPKRRQSRTRKVQKEEELEEPVKTKPARLRKSSSKASITPEEVPETKPKLKRSNSRAKTAVDKTEAETKTTEVSRGRSRKPIAQSGDESKKETRVKRETKRKPRTSNFSNENPFQSGSESERSRSRTRSRTRMAREAEKSAKEHVFKVPEGPAFSKFMRTPPPVVEIAKPKTVLTKRSNPPKPELVEEPPVPRNLDLAVSTQVLIKDIIQYARPYKLHISLFFFITVLLSYGLWLRETRLEIGFCTEVELESPTSRAWYYPTCIPCPDHAICENSDELPICAPEYILKPQLLSFGNVFPITPVCVLNKAKEYQSLQVADAAEKLLHIYAGNIECSLSSDKTPIKSAEYRNRRSIAYDDLRSQVEQLKDDNVSDEDFSQYWDRAIKELRQRTDKVSFEQGINGEERIRSLKPQKSLGCRIRQTLVRWIVKSKFVILALISSALCGVLIHVHITKRHKQSRVVSGLVQNVFSKLSDQAHYYYVDPVIYPEPYLPRTQLRDALLSEVESPSRRQEIWSKVESVVERNSNVRTSSQEVRGELHKVWEWIGPTGVLNQHVGESRGEGNSYESLGSSAGGSIRARGTPKIAPRTGPHGSFFGMRRQDSEYLNPENSLYPSLSQDFSS